jgi:hypothetical protein
MCRYALFALNFVAWPQDKLRLELPDEALAWPPPESRQAVARAVIGRTARCQSGFGSASRIVSTSAGPSSPDTR